jgi:hypothetical protein
MSALPVADGEAAAMDGETTAALAAGWDAPTDGVVAGALEAGAFDAGAFDAVPPVEQAASDPRPRSRNVVPSGERDQGTIGSSWPRWLDAASAVTSPCGS